MNRLVVFALVFLATSCALLPGPTTPPTQVGRLAQSGRQVIAAGESVLSGIDQLVTAGVLSKADAIRVVEVVKRIGVEGERLAKVLTFVDQTPDALARSRGIGQAGEMLKAIEQLVVEAGSGVGNVEARSKVLTLLHQITEAVVSLAILFPNATPA